MYEIDRIDHIISFKTITIATVLNNNNLNVKRIYAAYLGLCSVVVVVSFLVQHFTDKSLLYLSSSVHSVY